MRLKCSGLSVTFSSPAGQVAALRNVTFEIGAGEFVTIVGPSGCGKTTLLRTLAGLIAYQEGTVERIPSQPGGDTLIPLVFQEHSLFPWMTVLENAVFGLRMRGCGKEAREAQALGLLRRFGFAGREQAYPRELSLGMKQRVAVIRCFLSDAAVMLMDEPFAAVDYQTRLGLHRELLELYEQNSASVVYVTHDIEEAILLSNRILVLSAQPGTVVAEFRVAFPRPRETAITLEEDFLVLKRRIWAKLDRNLEAPAGLAEGRRA
jgi:NitT/TauT family transport system ATP-binding protein